MTSFDITFAILTSFSLNAWNACYINSYLFLTIVGCEKSELLVIFWILRLYDVIFYMLASFVIILWHFTTKILKPSIIIAWKWLIPILTYFWGDKSEFLVIFYIDVIWRHFCHFDVIFRKNESHATSKANASFYHLLDVINPTF